MCAEVLLHCLGSLTLLKNPLPPTANCTGRGVEKCKAGLFQLNRNAGPHTNTHTLAGAFLVGADKRKTSFTAEIGMFAFSFAAKVLDMYSLQNTHSVRSAAEPESRVVCLAVY